MNADISYKNVDTNILKSVFQLQRSAFKIRNICISNTDICISISNYIDIQISVFIIRDTCI